MAQKQLPITIHRLEAFSDGVIAIVITLMILEIKIPTVAANATASEIWSAWYNVLPSILVYILSFVMLGVLWVNHHQFFGQLKHVDGKLLWYNLHLLFWMCIVPIPTAFLGHHFQMPEATAVYGFTMFMNAVAFALMREYVNSNDHLFITNLSTGIRKRMRKKLWGTVVLYFISIFTGYISTYISLAIFVLIIVIYFMPQNIVVEVNE